MKKLEVGELLKYSCECGSVICQEINDTFFLYFGIEPLYSLQPSEDGYVIYSLKQGKIKTYPEDDLIYFEKVKKTKQRK